MKELDTRSLAKLQGVHDDLVEVVKLAFNNGEQPFIVTDGLRTIEQQKKLVAAGVSKEKIGLEAKKLGITEKHYDDWYKVETAKMGIMAGSRADAQAERSELGREKRVDIMMQRIQADPTLMMLPFGDKLAMAQKAVNAGREVQETPKFPGFSLVTPKK